MRREDAPCSRGGRPQRGEVLPIKANWKGHREGNLGDTIDWRHLQAEDRGDDWREVSLQLAAVIVLFFGDIGRATPELSAISE